ncbi:YtxH domain-containing protein [uncultured Rummeliibacillus sp.]|uniref:YtxH domain-containing protein n=1 Tax=uncultured Rummeliibacillus sp. TaxID=762292 RepID=UPI0026165868|nr:YtxH domain-containing protein [uncultured Rummeliibacillus sp.]
MSNKLVTGIALGAVTGAALSMLDRHTRETTVRKVKHFMIDVQYYASNRQEIVDKLQSTASSVQSMYSTFMKDKDFYLEKINEIQELTPQVKDIVLETKEVLTAGIEKAKEKEKEVPTESVIHL